MTSVDRAWRGTRNDWRLHLLGVFSVAVAFVCLLSALLVVVNVDGVRERWSQTGRASVYLEDGATEDQVAAIERALRATAGVGRVRRVSSEDARHEIVGEGSDDVLASLPSEAFPASLEVELGADGAVTLDKLAAQLSSLPAVDEVETYRSWSDRLARVLNGGVSAAALLALVVLAAVASVVSSTIRLTLERRRIEVEILKLVGATDAYVRRPFVLEGAAQGGIGAAAALLLLGALYGIMRSHFDGALGTLLGYSPRFLPWTLSFGIILVGALLGAAAAHLSLRRLLVS
jgi:cell division transport system permease protein